MARSAHFNVTLASEQVVCLDTVSGIRLGTPLEVNTSTPRSAGGEPELLNAAGIPVA